MNVLLIVISIILLIAYLAYLARRKDYLLLKSPPQTQPLPRSKVEQAQRELSEFKKLPKPSSRRQLVEHNSEQFYLEKKLEQIQQETEREQKSYYLACKERDIAWHDYHQLFNNMTLLEKLFLPQKISEIKLLRDLYLDAEKRVDRETSKHKAQSRVRHHEESMKRQREAEIDSKTRDRDRASAPETLEEAVHLNQPIEEAFQEMQLENEAPDLGPVQPDDRSPATGNALTEAPTKNRDEGGDSPTEQYMGQEDFLAKYPEFSGMTYIDDSLSLARLDCSVLQDAVFDGAFFVSVIFQDRHQYKNCSFREVDFSYSRWPKAESPHRMLSCDFSNAKLNYARFEFIAFYNCNFENADLSQIQLGMVKFVNCNFLNATITGVDFSNSVMSVDMLETIDFSECASPPRNAETRPNSEMPASESNPDHLQDER